MLFLYFLRDRDRCYFIYHIPHASTHNTHSRTHTCNTYMPIHTRTHTQYTHVCMNVCMCMCVVDIYLHRFVMHCLNICVCTRGNSYILKLLSSARGRSLKGVSKRMIVRASMVRLLITSTAGNRNA